MNAYTTVPLTVFTQRHFVADFLQAKCDYREKTAVLRFRLPLVVDFLLVLIELFSLGVTTEALRAIIGSKSAISLQRGSVDPKFQLEGIAPTNHSSSEKTRLNGLSYGIQI